MGLTWGFKVNPVFSFGISNFISLYRNESTYELDLQALEADGSYNFV